MSSTILQNDGLQSMDWKQITFNQIVQRKTEELSEKNEAIAERYDSKTALFQAQAMKWATLKAGVNNASIAVENGNEGIDEIDDKLLQLRILVGNYAEETDSVAKEKLKTQFDDYIDEINRTADNYGKNYNPIGNVVSTDWTPNTISYHNDLADNETSLSGTYIGTDFYVDSDDGTQWIPDPGTSTITQYEVYNTENEPDSTKGEGFTSTRSGLQLNSYDPETGAVEITVDPNGEDATTVTGTMKMGGLGLMQSWFQDLDSEEGRAAIITAIDKADVLVSSAKSQMVSMQASINLDLAKVQRGLDGVTEQRSDSMRAQLTEQYELQTKEQQEIQILQDNFEQMGAQAEQYKNIFASSVQTNPLFDIIS